MIGRVLRSNGVVFILSALAMIATLVIGLGIASWFTAGQEMHEGDANFAHATTSFGLAQIEVCAYERCVSGFTLQLDETMFGKLGLATLLVGTAFGGLVLLFAKKRIADLEVPRKHKALAYALGVATIALTFACMFVAVPESLAYEIDIYSTARLSPMREVTSHAVGITTEPSLGAGGFLTLFGTLLGATLVWGARSPARLEPEVRPASPRVRMLKAQPAAYGPETDPFRAPPAAAPLLVVRPERQKTTPPVVENPQDGGPKLLH